MRCKPYDNTRNKLLTGRMKIKGKEYTLDLIERSGEILLSKNNVNDVRTVINSIQNYIDPEIRNLYQLIDVNVYQENIFHTKMLL